MHPDAGRGRRRRAALRAGGRGLAHRARPASDVVLLLVALLRRGSVEGASQSVRRHPAGAERGAALPARHDRHRRPRVAGAGGAWPPVGCRTGAGHGAGGRCHCAGLRRGSCTDARRRGRERGFGPPSTRRHDPPGRSAAGRDRAVAVLATRYRPDPDGRPGPGSAATDHLLGGPGRAAGQFLRAAAAPSRPHLGAGRPRPRTDRDPARHSEHPLRHPALFVGVEARGRDRFLHAPCRGEPVAARAERLPVLAGVLRHQRDDEQAHRTRRARRGTRSGPRRSSTPCSSPRCS